MGCNPSYIYNVDMSYDIMSEKLIVYSKMVETFFSKIEIVVTMNGECNDCDFVFDGWENWRTHKRATKHVNHNRSVEEKQIGSSFNWGRFAWTVGIIIGFIIF